MGLVHRSAHHLYFNKHMYFVIVDDRDVLTVRFRQEICFQAVATVCQALHFGMIFTTLLEGGGQINYRTMSPSSGCFVSLSLQGEKCTFLLSGILYLR